MQLIILNEQLRKTAKENSETVTSEVLCVKSANLILINAERTTESSLASAKRTVKSHITYSTQFWQAQCSVMFSAKVVSTLNDLRGRLGVTSRLSMPRA